MPHRIPLAALALVVSLLAVAPSAGAKVTILNDKSNTVDTISKGKCRVSGKKGNKDFFLAAKSDDGKFALTVFIDSPVFSGFGDTYTAYYGGEDPQIFLRRRSDGEVFSHFKLPGTPAGVLGAGAVAFRRDGRRVGVGLYAASNRSFTEGYAFAGPLNCRYTRR